ncbi:uncharacterized protein LOC135112516 [Scylla paramamosain]|uniref:uncharacterized protein LOC135112516 n=1 Tax=Scylla paramamosain TaxID=85552 RepID=UPI003082789D
MVRLGKMSYAPQLGMAQKLCIGDGEQKAAGAVRRPRDRRVPRGVLCDVAERRQVCVRPVVCETIVIHEEHVGRVHPGQYSVLVSPADEANWKKKVVEVVVVSSLPRSGSTLLAQVIAAANNSVLFFEPLARYQKVPCFKNGSCITDFVSSLFYCTFDDKFDVWLKGKGLFIGYYHPSVDRCFQWPREGSSTCRRRLDLRALCRGASVKVVKVIRSRLAWLAALLNRSNVKIIYLTRDPRASLASINRMGWDSLPSRRCAALTADLDAYTSLRVSHPDRITRLSLEEFSRNPIHTTQRIFDFLLGSSVLNDSVRRFLWEHTNTSRSWPNDGNMDTHRSSMREVEAWRGSVTRSQLREVEAEPACRAAITRLGHALFNTLENARNSSISLHLKTTTVPNV